MLQLVACNIVFTHSWASDKSVSSRYLPEISYLIKLLRRHEGSLLSLCLTGYLKGFASYNAYVQCSIKKTSLPFDRVH